MQLCLIASAVKGEFVPGIFSILQSWGRFTRRHCESSKSDLSPSIISPRWNNHPSSKDCSRGVGFFSLQLLNSNVINKSNRLYILLISLHLAEQRLAFRQDFHPTSLFLEFISIIYHPILVPEPKPYYYLALIEE